MRQRKWISAHQLNRWAGMTDAKSRLPELRELLKRRNIRPVIPHKENERARHDGRVRFNTVAYRGRCVIEQCVGWLKVCRRIGTRFEKLALNFHAMVSLAMIDRYLKTLFRDRA